MDKTPGQVAKDAFHRTSGHKVDEDWERAVAAAIAHARPQIEAAASAAAVEEAVKLVFEPWPDWRVLVDRIRAIATAPAGFVCVPVEPTQEMVISGKLMMDTLVGDNAKLVYKAMLAAARPK